MAVHATVHMGKSEDNFQREQWESVLSDHVILGSHSWPPARQHAPLTAEPSCLSHYSLSNKMTLGGAFIQSIFLQAFVANIFVILSFL